MGDDVTRILEAIDLGDSQAADELLPLVYEELRRLAAQKLSHEKPGQTLQATALVHEAYIRLVDVEKTQHWDSRGHFFAAAINSAVRWERHAMLAQRWLRVDVAGMDASTRLAYSRDVARASSERDKCIRALGLEPSKRGDPWSILDATATTRTEEAGSSNNKQPASPAHVDEDKDEQQDSPAPTCVTSHSEQPGTASPLEGLAN